MSMSYFPIHGLALAIFNKNDIEYFCQKAEVEYPDDLNDIFNNEVNYFDEDTIIEPNLYNLNKENIPEYSYSDCIVIYAEKHMKPFEAAYNSKEELINEFKSKYKEYIPDDFDYKSHIGEFSGVLWG